MSTMRGMGSRGSCAGIRRDGGWHTRINQLGLLDEPAAQLSQLSHSLSFVAELRNSMK